MAKGTDVTTLAGAMSGINERYGAGTVMHLNDSAFDRTIKATPTDIITLDLALGIGGLPRGRIVEIYGPESSGKTTVASHAVASAQAEGQKCLYVDSEHAFDPVYAEALGIDIDELLFSQPDNMEQALEVGLKMAETGDIGLIVFDSVAAMTPRAEIEGEMGQAHVGLQARLMSQALRKMHGVFNQTNTTAIFINQLRENIGVMYGSPEVTPGGKALKFYSSVRIDIRKKETLKDGDEAISNRVLAKIIKNKVAPPFKQAEFNIVFGKGVDKTAALLNVAVDFGVVQRSGAWYAFEGEQIGQGAAKAAAYLDEHPDVREIVTNLVKERVND